MEQEKLKFKIYYFVRFFADALFYPFMTLYFVAKSVTDREMGLLLAITPILTIVVNPMWNYLVKDMRISRRFLQIVTVIEGVLIFLVTKVDTTEAFAIIIGSIAVLCSPYIQIQDGFAATFANRNKVEYSSIRIWASISYVAGTLIGGYLGAFIGYDLLFLVSGIIFALTALLPAWIKPLETPHVASERPKRDLKALLRNGEFYKYLVFYTLVIGSVRIGDSFFGVYLTENFAITTIEFGWLYAAFVLVEVFAMQFMVVKGSRYSDKLMFIVAGVLFVLRFLIYTLDPPLPIIYVATLLRGAGWGIILYSHIKFIIKIVRVENVTAAILIVTLLFSIYTGVGNYLSGTFIAQYGYPKLYLVNMILIFAGLLFFILFTPKVRKPETEEIQGEAHAESQ